MQEQKRNEYSNGAGCFTRLYWMLVGNVILVILFISLVHNKPEFPSLADLGCLLAVASLMFVRYVDIRHLKGETGFNTPATLDHWRKYAFFLMIGSLGVWLVIRFLTFLFM